MADKSTEISDTISKAQFEADILRASWDRCSSEHGLSKNLSQPIMRVDEEQVVESRKSLEEIMAEAAPIVHSVRDTACNADYCVLMTDNRGTVVEGYADSSASRELAEIGLRQGAHWSEKAVGTNGIGTSIVARHAITVCGNNHYNQSLRGFNCCAAPFFGPDGRILGVLDVSGRVTAGSSGLFFAEYFVREAAANISQLLFRKWHRADRIVALAKDPIGLEFGAKALIAANDAGQIIGATREALELLGVAEVFDLEHNTVDALWNVSIDNLRPQSLSHVRLTTAGGINAYAFTFQQEMQQGHNSHAGAPRTSTPLKPTITGTKHKSPNRHVLTSLDTIAGRDARMKSCVDLSRKLRNSDIPILLLGETGVGKDRFARAFHDESERRDKPFTAVNCAAIPESLLASELFGYAPGTFTGGLKSGRIGKIAASNGGTLFLDEIGDMPVDLQAHLLRVLEEREVTPLGAKVSVSVDVRIICATHQELPKKIAEGLFRKDLYYRIKGAQLSMSPLRDRTDISHIITTIIAEERGDGAVIEISDEVIDIFRNYAWPGNIRELKSLLHLILSIGDENLITMQHLPQEFLQDAIGGSAEAVKSASSSSLQITHAATLEDAQEQAEQQRILHALNTNKWCVTQAARELAISRATLHRKIRKYEIVSPNERDA